MKTLAWMIIILVLAAFAGIALKTHAGYILISYQHWNIETQLWLAILFVLFAFLIFYMLMRLLGGLWQLRRSFRKRRKMIHERKAIQHNNRALCHYAEGNFSDAISDFKKSQHYNKKLLINYMGKILAAQQIKNYALVNDAAMELYAFNSTTKTVAPIVKAVAQIKGEQYDWAKATLESLYQKNTKHKKVIELLLFVYQKLQDWNGLKNILPRTKKCKLLNDQQFYQIEKQIARFDLEQCLQKNPSDVYACWKALSKPMQQEAEVIYLFCKALIQMKENEKATSLIENTLEKQWYAPLLELYGQIQLDSDLKRISKAEHWLKKHPKDPILLLCIGRLCLHEKILGKAQEYIEKSIEMGPTLDAYKTLQTLQRRR